MIVGLQLLVLSTLISHAAPYKVLVVMSYDGEYRWEQEIREGIEAVLGGQAELRYVYMDTKNNLAGGPEMARQAYETYKDFKPDGVIAADDNAQSMFVVPFLREKVNTPVIFCGVNADPGKYGYPAANVTGVTERLHLHESLSFAQQLIPGIRKVGFLQKESPSGQASQEQYQRELANYPVESVGFKLPRTLAEAKEVVAGFRQSADALFFETLEGIPDEKGRPLNDRAVIPILAKIFGKPIISNNLYHVEYGTLCAIIKKGQEQGGAAAGKLLEILRGKPVSAIPVSAASEGEAVLNVTVMQEMGIIPRPITLKGVRLVRTMPKFKVLVVMSYEEDFPWDAEVREGIETGLAGTSDVRYFYMNTKIDLAGGPAKAREAYQVFLDYRPDGVIASDDNAQSMFVVPYLKDKVTVPVMFCGVNAEPEKYGYPAGNVSGILERGHIKESIAFVQEMMPAASNIAFMAKESPTGQAVLAQAQREAGQYSMTVVDYFLPSTVDEALAMSASLKTRADVLFVATMQGLVDENGAPRSEKDIIPRVGEIFGKPLISDNSYDMKYGMMCAIAVSGVEQGVKAARNLVAVMRGAPMATIPISRNDQGKRIVNVSILKRLGIVPPPSSLIGVELIRTEE